MRRLVGIVLLVSVLVSCDAQRSLPPPPPAPLPDPPLGALIRVTLTGEVGVLLDSYPSEMRARVATAITNKPAAFWEARARWQIRHLSYRLMYRAGPGERGRQLPLPPESVWRIELDPAGPAPRLLDGHSSIAVRYTFESVLVSDAESPAEAEPLLGQVGGQVALPFVVPLDPEALVARTGAACLDQRHDPPGSIIPSHAFLFFNDTCDPASGERPACHGEAPPPERGCVAALRAAGGAVPLSLRFERIGWDAALAGAMQVGTADPNAPADLTVVASALADQRIVYRYIPPDSCALAEACVTRPGWRRLLLFDATAHNIGASALEVGEAGPDRAHHRFTYSACHQHFHFAHYGLFRLDTLQATSTAKQAFCLQSNRRLSNNPLTPLVTPYDACAYQGLSPGWGDSYPPGLECQWLDITDHHDQSATLTFQVNPDGMLCEGRHRLDGAGLPRWEPSSFLSPDGHPVSQPDCDWTAGWADNNQAQVALALPPDGGAVTAPCQAGELGPDRDCGFAVQGAPTTCAAGEPVTLLCQSTTSAPPQTVRLCEASAAQGIPIPCEAAEALGSGLVGEVPVPITFICPAPRDAEEAGGRFAILAAPAFAEDRAAPVTCEALRPAPVSHFGRGADSYR